MIDTEKLTELRNIFAEAVKKAKGNIGFVDIEPNDNRPDNATTAQNEVSDALYHCQQIYSSSGTVLARTEYDADTKSQASLFAKMSDEWKQEAEPYKQSNNRDIFDFVEKAEAILDYVASSAEAGPQ